jgi:hypothetical protein
VDHDVVEAAVEAARERARIGFAGDVQLKGRGAQCAQPLEAGRVACGGGDAGVCGPGRPSPISRPSTRLTGVTPPSVPVTKASSAE